MYYVACEWCGSAVPDSCIGSVKSCPNCGAPTDRFRVGPPPVQPAHNQFYDFLDADLQHPRIKRTEVKRQNSRQMVEFRWRFALLIICVGILIVLSIDASQPTPTADDGPTNEATIVLEFGGCLVMWGGFGLICVAIIARPKSVRRPASNFFGLNRELAVQRLSRGSGKARQRHRIGTSQIRKHVEAALSLRLTCSISSDGNFRP